MTRSAQPEVVELGRHAGVRFLLARTAEPWDLDIDTLIVRVDDHISDRDDVETALRIKFPGVLWEPTDYIDEDATVRHLDISGATGHRRLKFVSFAAMSPTRSTTESTTTLVRALTLTAALNGRSVGLPYLYLQNLRQDEVTSRFSTLQIAFDHSLSKFTDTVFLYTADFSIPVQSIRSQWSILQAPAVPQIRTLEDIPDRIRVHAIAKLLEEPVGVVMQTLVDIGESVRSPQSFISREVAFRLAGVLSPEASAPEPRELAGGVSRDLVDPNEYITADQDKLGVSTYVSMLATVIAAKDTPLPLSIGLFGEWGSGKSFFMGMLRGQLRALEGAPGNCAKIAQIGFNAWHYADANLWASLGDEIFRQLSEPRRRPGETDAEHDARQREGERLRTQLAAALEQRQQLDAVTQRAEAEATALREKIGEAGRNRKSQARRILRVMRQSKSARAEVDKVWSSLGVEDEVEQGRLLAEQVRGTLDEAEELQRVSRARRGRGALLLAGFVLLAGLCAGAFVPFVKEWLAGVCAVAGGLLATGTVWLRRAHAGLRRLRTLAEELQVGLAESPARKELAALARAESDQQVAEAQLQEVVARIGELGGQLTELTPGRRLYAFLAERSQSGDYRGNLGLISTIRRDFEKLVALMTPKPGDNGAPGPVDRIVLYIDDLDRCSPQQVVEVLQAVHLLLAFDLFVVVVGVDPRWLLRSISSHYDQLIESGPATRDDGWRISPEDYLEKILNIPLVLPGMPADGLEQLLRGLITSSDEAGSGALAIPSVLQSGTFVSDTGKDAGSVPVEEGSQVASQLDPDRPPETPHPLTPPEIELLAKLNRLIETPRDFKRLLNLYRMVRSTRNLSAASAFLGGEYQAVILLLATFAAHPQLIGRFADALMHTSPEISWTDFVTGLNPEQHGSSWRNSTADNIDPAEVPQWNHLHDSLRGLAGAVTLTEVRDFQAWVPRIRPFSYVLARTTG